MTELFIVNLAGSASPSEVKQLAKDTAAYGGEWVSSQIHYMDSQVSALIKVQSAHTQSELIQQLFKRNPNLHTIITPCRRPYHDASESYLIILTCHDRAGLIRDINHKLELQNAKVLSFSSQRVFIARTDCVDHQEFCATIEVQLPSKVLIEDVIHELETLHSSINIKLSQTVEASSS